MEEANQDQEMVIESLSKKYEGVVSQCQQLQQQILYDDESSGQQLDHRIRIRLDETSRCEERHAAQIGVLHNEINDLRNEHTSRENENEALEYETETLMRKVNEKESELRKARDYVEWLNEENKEYVARIEGYESELESTREEANKLEESRAKLG